MERHKISLRKKVQKKPASVKPQQEAWDQQLTHQSEGDQELVLEDERALLALSSAWDSLDSQLSTETPSTEWFQQQIAARKILGRKRFVREMLSFLLVALLIMSVWIGAVWQKPYLFIGIQGVSLLVAPVVLVLLSRKGVKI